MRGKYRMMDWEIDKWRNRLITDLHKLYKGHIKKIDLVKEDVCPANIITILVEELGFEEVGFDTNGWQCDVWYSFEHPNTHKKITLYYEGYTFDFQIYLTEEE